MFRRFSMIPGSWSLPTRGDHFCHVGFLWTLPLTTRSQTFVPHSPFPFPVPRSPFPVPRSPFLVPRSPFPVTRSPFHVLRSPLPAPGSRLICSPVWAPAPVHFFFFFFWLSHSGFSRNTSNGNRGSIKSFPTNKVYFEEKKKRLRNGIGIWSRFQGIFRGLFIINVFFTSLVIFGDL